MTDANDASKTEGEQQAAEEPSYYDILGVSCEATSKEVVKAFRKLAITKHPDKGGDVDEFQIITKAYETLSNEKKRKVYDNPELAEQTATLFGGIRMDDVLSNIYGGKGAFKFFNPDDHGKFGDDAEFEEHIKMSYHDRKAREKEQEKDDQHNEGYDHKPAWFYDDSLTDEEFMKKQAEEEERIRIEEENRFEKYRTQQIKRREDAIRDFHEEDRRMQAKAEKEAEDHGKRISLILGIINVLQNECPKLLSETDTFLAKLEKLNLDDLAMLQMLMEGRDKTPLEDVVVDAMEEFGQPIRERPKPKPKPRPKRDKKVDKESIADAMAMMRGSDVFKAKPKKASAAGSGGGLAGIFGCCRRSRPKQN